MKKLLFVAPVMLALSMANARGATIADSVDDFSGTQGAKGWHYGYYDGGRNYTHWMQLAHYGEYEPVGETAWYRNPIGTVYNFITKTDMHPGDERGGKIANTVRRWVCSVTGKIIISGDYAVKPNSADGVTLLITVNGGSPIWSTNVPPQTTGLYSVSNVLVKVADSVDFVLDPGPKNDGDGDRVSWSQRIEFDQDSGK